MEDLLEVDTVPHINKELSASIKKEGMQRKGKSAKEMDLEIRPATRQIQLIGGCNTAILMDLKDDGSGVFKPVDGEKKLRSEVEPGSYYKRERASYLVDSLLGLDLVPPTVIRNVDGNTGSMQDFLDGARNIWDLEKGEELNREQLYKLWIFDGMIWNSDRHVGNIMVEGDKIYAIDNGLTFGNDRLMTFDKHYNTRAPEEIINKLGNYLGNEMNQRVLEEMLGELLPGEEVAAFRARTQYLGHTLANKGRIGVNEFPSFFPK